MNNTHFQFSSFILKRQYILHFLQHTKMENKMASELEIFFTGLTFLVTFIKPRLLQSG